MVQSFHPEATWQVLDGGQRVVSWRICGKEIWISVLKVQVQHCIKGGGL